MFCAGCFDIEYRLVFHNDDTEDVYVTFALDQQLPQVTDELGKRLKKAGYEISTRTEGEKYYLTGHKKVSGGGVFIPGLYRYAGPGGKVSFREVNYLFLKTTVLNITYSIAKDKLAKVQSDAFWQHVVVPFKYVICPAGRVLRHNGAEVRGKEYIWNYVLKGDENVNVGLTFYKFDYPALALVLLVCVLLLIGGGRLLKRPVDLKRAVIVPVLALTLSILIILSYPAVLEWLVFAAGLLLFVAWKMTGREGGERKAGTIMLYVALILICGSVYVIAFNLVGSRAASFDPLTQQGPLNNLKQPS
jgi:hypothetical protein